MQEVAARHGFSAQNQRRVHYGLGRRHRGRSGRHPLAVGPAQTIERPAIDTVASREGTDGALTTPAMSDIGQRRCRRRPGGTVLAHRQPLPAAAADHRAILLTAHLSFGILEGWERTALAIVTAIVAEMVMGRAHLRRLAASGQRVHQRHQRRHPGALAVPAGRISSPASSRSPRSTCCRFRGRHLWNPTNFGVSAVVFLAPATVAVLSVQWGNVVAPMAVIWVLGTVIVWRVGRLPHLGDLRAVVPAVLVRPRLR